MTSYLQRRVPEPERDGQGARLDAGEWSSSFPAVSEFLGACTWPDGTARMPGTLTLFTDNGQWKLCLSDKDQSLLAFVSGPTPLDVFQAAESGLVTGVLDWRPSGGKRGNKRG